MKILFILALATLSTSASAASFWSGVDIFGTSTAVPPGVTLQKLVNLTSDQDNKVSHLSVMIDSSNNPANNMVRGMFKADASGLIDFSPAAADSAYWLEAIESPDGALMLEARGRKVLILMGNLNRNTQEGRFKIKFLSNGLSMTYKFCEFQLRKSGTNWFIENIYTGAPVTDVKVLTHSLGITTLQGICPQ